MAQAGQDGGLAAELPGELVGGEQVLLDRHRHAEVDVDRLVDGPHPTLTQDAFNAVAISEDEARLQWHAVLERGCRMPL